MEENISQSSIYATPRPTATSTAQKKKTPANDISLRSSSGSDESLGILSIRSEDMGYLDSSTYLKEQRQLASQSLLKNSSKISSIPSRFLRPNYTANANESTCNLSSGSSISESDLLKNTSTPRSSYADIFSPRYSLGASLNRLSNDITSSNISVNNVLEEFRKATTFPDSDFVSGSKIESKLLADEESWQKEKGLPALPVNITEPNLDESFAPKMSIGQFFKQRSENVSDLMDSSYRDKSRLRPLVEVNENVNDSPSRSLSISKISKVLSEHETPTKAIEYLIDKCKLPETTAEKNKVSPMFSFEGLKTDVDNKENISTNSGMKYDPNKSVTSIRSSSSLDFLSDGKLPIESTKKDLVWGCIRVGKTAVNQFILRNKSPNRVRLQCTTSSATFKILKERSEQEMTDCLKMVLLPHESKSISIAFSPVTLGAAIGELNFTPTDVSLQQTQKQNMRLYGYGGYCKFEFVQGVLLDSSGKPWISFGDIYNTDQFNQSFKIQNKGTLTGFAYFNFAPKDCVFFSNVKISPTVCVINPREQVEVRISYNIRADDLKYMKKCNSAVVDVGALKIICGAEATRGRLRRLCRKQLEKKLPVEPIVQMLHEPIRDENIPPDVIEIKEFQTNLKDLLNDLNRKEIVLTLEQDLDHTLVENLGDDTSLFQTICDASQDLENTVMLRSSCKIQPTSLYLMPPVKTEDTLFLVSESNEPVSYRCAPSSALEIVPMQGVVRPRSTEVLKIKCKKGNLPKKMQIPIQVGSEVLHCEVVILN